MGEKATAKFDETMEFHARLGLDPKYNDQQLRTTVSLPKGTGKQVSIGVLCEAADAQAALDAGAAKAGMDDLLAEISEGNVDFDVLLAVPAAMPKLATFGKASFDEAALKENLTAVIKCIETSRPSGAKGK